jgi:hypothetical protein
MLLYLHVTDDPATISGPAMTLEFVGMIHHRHAPEIHSPATSCWIAAPRISPVRAATQGAA